MIALAFLQWWYGPGWLRAVRTVEGSTRKVARNFSLKLLLQTLFSPWRRIITYGSTSFIDSLKAGLDNVISRCVGAVVRMLVILAGTLLMAVAAVLGLILILVWPLLPFLGVGMIIFGVVGW